MTRYAGPIIDVDVHQRWKSIAEVVARLSPQWQRYLRDNAPASSLKPPKAALGNFLANAARRADSFPADGTAPGSDYPLMREQWLDPCGISHALLTLDVGEYGAQLNQFFAADLCRAINDWSLETWLTYDERFCSVIAVPVGAPAAAAAEIRRLGAHPRVVGVVLSGNVLARPYGDPVYDPVYEAAAELDLTIVVHPTGAGDRTHLQTLVAGGPPASTTVNASQFTQQAMHYISSFVSHGTFEKFPGLRVLMQEYGIGWLPWLLWRLDQNQEVMRAESPWLRRAPSEYVLRHVKVSTQPIEEGPEPGDLRRLLESYDGLEDILCFASDYPHMTADEPGYVSRALPRAWLPKVFHDNARRLFRWPETKPAMAAAAAAS